MGYFVVTTAYSLGRLYVGPWLGWRMQLLNSLIGHRGCLVWLF